MDKIIDYTLGPLWLGIGAMNIMDNLWLGILALVVGILFSAVGLQKYKEQKKERTRF